MLDGLDAVDWGRLMHAYGAAVDVPETIRALLSDDPAARDEALEALFCTIWHQGTVYPATAYAAPFLIELLADPACRETASILHLLGCMAQGASYIDVHYRGEERDKPGVQERLREELTDVAAAHEAAAEGILVYLRRLRDPDVEVRREAAALLGAFGERAPGIVPALLARLGEEPDAEAGATAVDSLSRLAPRDPAVLDSCTRLLGAEAPAGVRFAAARLLVLALRDAAPASAVDILIETFADPERYPYGADTAARALGELGPARGPDALIAALAVVAAPDDALEAAAVLLERTFERRVPVMGRAYSMRAGRRRIEFWGMGRVEPDRVRELSALQRQVVEAILGCAAFAAIDTNLLDLYGLPADAGQLERLIA